MERRSLLISSVIIVIIILFAAFYLVTTLNSSIYTSNSSKTSESYYAPSLHYYNSSSLVFNSTNQVFITNVTKLGEQFPYDIAVFMLPRYVYGNYTNSVNLNASSYIEVFQNKTNESIGYYYSDMMHTLSSLGISNYSVKNGTTLGYPSFSMHTSVKNAQIYLTIIGGPYGRFTYISMNNLNASFSSEMNSSLNQIMSSLNFSN